MISPKKGGTALHMAFSTPFRGRFFSCFPFSATVSSVVGKVCSSKGLGVHDTFNGTNVFNHGFGDGGQVVCFEFHDKVVIAKEDRSIRYVRECLDVVVDLLFHSRMNIDEDVTDCHVAHFPPVDASTSPFRFGLNR